MGLYVYAVGKAGEAETPSLQGVLDRSVYRLEAASLCAIVSECPLDNVRAERKHIAATQRVLSAVNAKFDLLPMAFGTVAKSEEVLRSFLNDKYEALSSQMKRVSGSVEMALRLSLDVPDPIAYLVARTPALKAARDRTFRARHKPSYDDKIRLGQQFDQALTNYREALTVQVLATIGDSCSESIELPIRDEKQIANLAILVPRTGLEAFGAAISTAAAQIDYDVVFNLSGPWPPHNFVQLNVEAT
ncbi:MAG: GvpL/GvpF family gas vesicle protein [Roseiarcus sp.]